MDQQADAPLQPGEARVENQIDEARERGCRGAALVPIHMLLGAGERRVLICRQRRVRSAVPVPIAVVCMVIVVMLRPHVLRHPRYDAEQKPARAIEPTAAKQTAVAAFVHQAEHAYGKQDDGQQWNQDEPGGHAGAPDGNPPEEHERSQGREDLLQSLDVIGPGISTDHGAFLAPEAVIRHHDRLPPGLYTHRIHRHVLIGTLRRVRLGLNLSSMFLAPVPRQSSAFGSPALGSVSQSERVIAGLKPWSAEHRDVVHRRPRGPV